MVDLYQFLSPNVLGHMKLRYRVRSSCLPAFGRHLVMARLSVIDFFEGFDAVLHSNLLLHPAVELPVT